MMKFLTQSFNSPSFFELLVIGKRVGFALEHFNSLQKTATDNPNNTCINDHSHYTSLDTMCLLKIRKNSKQSLQQSQKKQDSSSKEMIAHGVLK